MKAHWWQSENERCNNYRYLYGYRCFGLNKAAALYREDLKNLLALYAKKLELPEFPEGTNNSAGGARMKQAKVGIQTPATLERMLYYLKLTREAESRIEHVLYRQGKIVGGVYIGRGQEALGVGSALQLIEGDVVLPSHRDFSSFLIRGFSLADIFANWMGRADTPTRGRDNTLHIGDMKRGVIPIISPLGGTCPVACGVGMVLKRRGHGNVALVHLGEGTTSVGQVHEAMNMAAVMKLPVIFLCNNNGYAYSTPVEKQFAVKNLSVRGPAYGMPGETLDGNDVLVVYRVVGEAVLRARQGKGPSFLEGKTFRMAGHSAHDAAEYVPAGLLEQWAKKDPIQRLETYLLSTRIMTRQRIDDLNRRIQEEIDAAIADAEARPLPKGGTALEGVYCGPECWWKKDGSHDSGVRSPKSGGKPNFV